MNARKERLFRVSPVGRADSNKQRSLTFVCCVALALAVTGQAFAVPMDTSWIFRSQVAEGSSMWGPGTHTSFNFSGKYVADTWPIAGTGLEWAVMADQGTVHGNVEGLVRAKYDNYVHGSKTKIDFSYAGIDGESNINTSFGVSLTATPRFRAEVWPFPAIDMSVPLSFLNESVRAGTDFTTGLGQLNTGSGRWEPLPFSLEAAIFAGYLNLAVGQDIYFTPKSILGKVTATHFDTGATRTADVLFGAGALDAAVELDLDLKGHWDIRLESFSVGDNTFRQELGYSPTLGFKVPILGVDLAFKSELDLFAAEFPLAFNNHGYDGNAATPDVLGRFSIYVDPVPEPASIACLALAGLRLLTRRRRLPRYWSTE